MLHSRKKKFDYFGFTINGNYLYLPDYRVNKMGCQSCLNYNKLVKSSLSLMPTFKNRQKKLASRHTDLFARVSLKLKYIDVPFMHNI